MIKCKKIKEIFSVFMVILYLFIMIPGDASARVEEEEGCSLECEHVVVVCDVDDCYEYPSGNMECGDYIYHCP